MMVTTIGPIKNGPKKPTLVERQAAASSMASTRSGVSYRKHCLPKNIKKAAAAQAMGVHPAVNAARLKGRFSLPTAAGDGDGNGDGDGEGDSEADSDGEDEGDSDGDGDGNGAEAVSAAAPATAGAVTVYKFKFKNKYKYKYKYA